MQLLNDEQKNTIQLAWLSVLEALYTFAPWQRLVLVGCIVMLVPGYWLVRVGTRIAYGMVYKKYQITARPAFEHPQALQAGALTILPVRTGSYVAYAKVSNPNLKIAATQFVYTAVLYTAQGTQAYHASGQAFVAPAGDVWVVLPAFTPAEVPTSGALEIAAVTWQQKFSLPDVPLAAPDPVRFSEEGGVRLEGVVVNNSPYRLGSVRVVLLVQNRAGAVVGVADRTEFSVVPREQRGYVVRIPGVRLEDVARVVAVPYTNTSDLSNIQVANGGAVQQDDRPAAR